ncbi:MAG: NAD(P)/FAD-dependent oxidoreductase [Candidatus Thorarchaeota archaeon]
MMSKMKHIGIIGNGVSAVTAIRELRTRNPDVLIDVFSDEGHLYYPRPRLIDFVRDWLGEEEVIQYDIDWYKKMNVNLHLGEKVVDIVPSSKSILTELNSYFNYDKLLLAVGSSPFVPPIHGVDRKGVYTMRTMDDAYGIRDAVKGAGREIIVGGGILGIELAAAIKASGGEPIVISNITTLLPDQLDQGASHLLYKMLDRMGLSVLLGFNCVKVLGHEYATGIESTIGDKVKGDMIVIATGVRPNTKLAENSGLEVGKGRGFVVDKHMQTSEPGIFAAGDCIEWDGESLGIIPVAIESAQVAAQNMLDLGSVEYEGTTPSNTLKVAGIDLTSIGMFNPQSPEYDVILSVDEGEGTYFKAVLKENKVVGGIALGDRKVAVKIRRLVLDKTDITDFRREIFEV